MLALSAVLLILSFSFSLHLFYISRQAAQQRTWFTVYPISDIGRCQKFANTCTFFTPRAAEGYDFELSITVNNIWKLESHRGLFW